jgi:protein SHQ1
MITPRFKLRQDLEFVYVLIYLPYVKISDCEVYIEGCEFSCYVKPYLLKLTFPHPLVEDGREKASYRVEEGVLECRVPKAQHSQEFEDLELMAKLLSPRKQPASLPPQIEVLGEASVDIESEPLPSTDFRYGFNRGYSNLFTNLTEEMHELADLDPSQVSVDERLPAARAKEQQDFDLDRYLTDMDEDLEEFETRLFQHLFTEVVPSLSELLEPMSLDALVRLGNKDLLVNAQLTQVIWCQVLDVVLAFAYEMRTMAGELTCESAYNINKLAVSLSCLAELQSPAQVFSSFMRRVLVYGIYRSHSLCSCSLSDVKALFAEGRLCLVRVMLKVKGLFERSEPRYLLNRLFIDDLAIWLQKVPVEQFTAYQLQIQGLETLPIEASELDFSFKD